jgi:membrane protein
VTVARWNGGTVGLTGAIAFVWAASSGLHAIFEALEIEAGEERSWLRKRMMALGGCAALSVAVALLALLGPGLEAAAHFVGRRLPLFDTLSTAVSGEGRIFRAVVSFAIALASTCLIYRFGVPRHAREKLPVLPGAFIAVLSQTLLSFLYTAYVTEVGGGAAYGASLAIVALAMTALYLFALSLLAGAVINRRIGLPRAPCPPSPASKGGDNEASGLSG